MKLNNYGPKHRDHELGKLLASNHTGARYSQSELGSMKNTDVKDSISMAQGISSRGHEMGKHTDTFENIKILNG